MVLGRDFLKKNRVLVDHETDEIQIRAELIELVKTTSLNKIDCFLAKPVVIEPLSEKLVFAKVGKLELNRIMII